MISGGDTSGRAASALGIDALTAIAPIAPGSPLCRAHAPGGFDGLEIALKGGQVGGPDRSVYCASKWAMEGWTRAMAIDLAPHGIRANTLCPTFIETPLTRPFFERPGFRDWVLSKIKLGRVGQVQDLMGAVVFLASDASALMTGTSLTVDGGWTAD